MGFVQLRYHVADSCSLWGERSSEEIEYYFKKAGLLLCIHCINSVAPPDIWQVLWLCQRFWRRSLGTDIKCSTRKQRGEEIAALRRENICSVAKWLRELFLQTEMGLTSLQQCFELPPGCLEVVQDLLPPAVAVLAVSILHPQMDAGSHVGSLIVPFRIWGCKALGDLQCCNKRHWRCLVRQSISSFLLRK